MQSLTPSEYFPGIKFNYSFYTTGDTKVTLEYCNNNYLRCTGYAYSRSITTTFNGILYCLGGIEYVIGVVSSPVSSLPKAKYDHETTLKCLIKNTVAVMETLKDDYESVVYMGSLCDYWKSLITQDRALINEHNVFMKHFRKVRHLYGLPVYGKNGLADLTIDDSENEEAGAA